MPRDIGDGGRSAAPRKHLMLHNMTSAFVTFTSHVAGKDPTGSIPIRAITSVTTRKDGQRTHAVSIVTAGNTIDMNSAGSALSLAYSLRRDTAGS